MGVRSPFMRLLAAALVATLAAGPVYAKDKKRAPALMPLPMLPLPAAARGPEPKKTMGGTIAVVCSVPGAKVLLNGVEMGETPMGAIGPVVAGKHVISVRKPGFSELKTQIDLADGQALQVDATLLAYAGVLGVEAGSAGAQVYLDGVLVGEAPISGRELIPGEHVVSVKKDGFEPFETHFRVRAGQEYAVRAQLSSSVPLRKVRATDPGLDEALREPSPAREPRLGEQEWYSKWWVWAIAGGVAVAATSIGVASASGPASNPHYCSQVIAQCGPDCKVINPPTTCN